MDLTRVVDPGISEATLAIPLPSVVLAWTAAAPMPPSTTPTRVSDDPIAP